MNGKDGPAPKNFRAYASGMTMNRQADVQPPPVDAEFVEVTGGLPAVRRTTSTPGAERLSHALVPRDPEGKPWDIMRGEHPKWFARFEVFRSFGPGRSIVGAYRTWIAAEAEHADLALRATRVGQVRKRATQTHQASAPSATRRIAETWRWWDRARAWDEAQIDLARAEEQERLLQAARDRVSTGKTLRALGVRAITLMKAKDLKPMEALQAIKLGDELIAKGMGLDAKENQAASDTIHVKVLDLSDDGEDGAVELPSATAMLGPGDPDADVE